ncbi:transposase-like protein [Chromobacterium alkanivorans]|uniref:hypothetical protein n=1 Tax=Chromobacterium alkanivorans TaxID=1071719 RepID=UPI002169D5EB|nr:hypothetical protein [Chromobacterium alkanivorans]MCS3802736.1 transposase-like protein [Chromobacterium alkanivorans]MCS3817062.1 transposase-like protein [Chromobacterium alkanivorans]MCS3872102.1 transposase-like protein [Chromobacterium alkanivorans]
MTKARHTFPEALKCDAIAQVFAPHYGMLLKLSTLQSRCLASGNAKPDAFLERGKQTNEAVERKRLRDELTRITMEPDALKTRSKSLEELNV